MKNDKENIISNRRNARITLILINYAIEKYPKLFESAYIFHKIQENEYNKFYNKYINILIKQIPILKKYKSIMIKGAKNNETFINDFRRYLIDLESGRRYLA